ncbi:MAG: hypothetical protein K9N49_10535, partial [Candidatus Marinimicrobia bacterium]|nr:hypothetical protein [Candidatus Neomarinimicrobiota bacterium]
RLDEVAQRLPESAASEAAAGNPAGAERLRQWHAAWVRATPTLRTPPPADTGAPARQAFLDAWSPAAAQTNNHLEAVRALPPDACAAATAWLNAIVAAVEAAAPCSLENGRPPGVRCG